MQSFHHPLQFTQFLSELTFSFKVSNLLIKLLSISNCIKGTVHMEIEYPIWYVEGQRPNEQIKIRKM